MARTKALSSITTTPQAVTVQTQCTLVTVEEDSTLTPVGLKKRAPNSSDSAIPKPAGVAVAFIAPAGSTFYPNQTVGYVEAVSGSTSGFQDEN